jgi:hypothetical protein
MTYRDDDNEFKLDKEIDIEVDLDLDIDVDVKVEKDVDIDIYFDADVDINGNFAELILDAQAHGKDTAVEVEAVVLTFEDELSMITLHVVSAVD